MNIARFDLVSMQLIVLCAQTGSLSAAVKRVHCSVSTGSLRLSAMEQAIGRRLFLRDARGLRLTKHGAVFVRHAESILEQLEVLTTQMALPGNE